MPVDSERTAAAAAVLSAAGSPLPTADPDGRLGIIPSQLLSRSESHHRLGVRRRAAPAVMGAVPSAVTGKLPLRAGFAQPRCAGIHEPTRATAAVTVASRCLPGQARAAGATGPLSQAAPAPHSAERKQSAGPSGRTGKAWRRPSQGPHGPAARRRSCPRDTEVSGGGGGGGAERSTRWAWAGLGRRLS
jgi:hypothetical protein